MNSIDPQSLPHVVGAGMGRTGTKSLKRALETLGAGPIFHMENALPTAPRLGQYWEALAKLTPVSMLPNGDPVWPPWLADRTHGLEKERRVDLLRHVLGWSNSSILETETKEKVPFPLSFLLGEWMAARETVQFQGNVDFPLFVHFMDLLEVYRDDGRPVKVVLTSRETGETWAKSALDSILNYHPSRRPWGIQVFCSTIFRIPDRMLENTFYRYFPNDMSDESKALGPLAEMHDSWNNYVRESMKSYAEQQGIPLDSIFLDY